MWIALGINVVLLLAEIVGGLVTGSLAVLADAGHLLSDVGSIALAPRSPSSSPATSPRPVASPRISPSTP